MILLLIIWGAWFVGARIPIRLSSDNAEVTGSLKVTATFPSDTAGQIVRGHKASFQPNGNGWANTEPIPAMVASVADDTTAEGNHVEITLHPEESLSAPLKEGLKGRVVLELDQVSPAILLMRGAGMTNQAEGNSQEIIDD